MAALRGVWLLFFLSFVQGSIAIDKPALRQKALSLFMHGYDSYMKYAFPADELMPLSCKGRVRGVTPSRGDVDDSLGNFSLTLVDTLDTLVVVGAFDEFERSARYIVENVRLDSDMVVSVFETNIRMLGGLLSGHLMAQLVQAKEPHRLVWYDKQLLTMAVELGDRLLPAFNTTSGIPYSRINLKHGMQEYLLRQKDTCTACGGTLLLEMAALSRLSGNPIYEIKARKAMDFLWAQRHRASDLMGTVLNVHSGDWVRRESGIGAGIDSYYEYCLKAYILLGDISYLDRFNTHYDAIMRYVNKGPLFVDVHMHRPTVATRSFMDALLAFWPGLQVLKGDIKEAIEMHEMLFQVVKKHKFLPEAFTHDFQVHWAEHPLRPEFIESTYFLYRATKDPHYLDVAAQVMNSIEQYVKVPCGFAGVKDVRTMTHEDRMDSFVLSETFKYLYLIFTEPADLLFDMDNYVLTTEAHFLPLSMGSHDSSDAPRRVFIHREDVPDKPFVYANPFSIDSEPTAISEAQEIRERTKSVLEELFLLQKQQHSDAAQCVRPSERLRAWAFSAANTDHVKLLREMGIDIQIQGDGRLQLSHHAPNGDVVSCLIEKDGSSSSLRNLAFGIPANSLQIGQMMQLMMLMLIATSNEYARWGFEFMREMMEYAAQIENNGGMGKNERAVQVLSSPWFGSLIFNASPAQFGPDLATSVMGQVALSQPLRGCSPLLNGHEVVGKIAVIERSDCVFQEKVKNAQDAGAIGVIVIDHLTSSPAQGQPLFAMAGDKGSPDDIFIPSVFLYRKEAEALLKIVDEKPRSVVNLCQTPHSEELLISNYFNSGPSIDENFAPTCPLSDGDFIVVDNAVPSVTFRFRFGDVDQDSDPLLHQAIVERHVSILQDFVEFSDVSHRAIFFNLLRTAAYGALNLNVQDEPLKNVKETLRSARSFSTRFSNRNILPGPIIVVRCAPHSEMLLCSSWVP